MVAGSAGTLAEMDETLRIQRSRTFEGVADVYARSRPGYPERAVRWLLPGTPSTVLELGAGTGKLTTTVASLGHRVVATDPAAAMLEQLTADLDVPAVQTGAELLPFRANSFDVVLVGQAFHWFDADRALPEIARVLRDGGELALVWNVRDEAVPWVHKLTEIVGNEGGDFAWLDAGPLPASDLFGPLERKDFGFWQRLDLDALLDLMRSRSYVAAQDDAAREQLLDRVRALYAEYAQGADGLQMRYLTVCFRTRVDRTALPPEQADPPDDGDLLFDFR